MLKSVQEKEKKRELALCLALIDAVRLSWSFLMQSYFNAIVLVIICKNSTAFRFGRAPPSSRQSGHFSRAQHEFNIR